MKHAAMQLKKTHLVKEHVSSKEVIGCKRHQEAMQSVLHM
jgi:hypothetical protein